MLSRLTSIALAGVLSLALLTMNTIEARAKTRRRIHRTPDVLVMPTPADQALAERFSTLRQMLDIPAGPGLELVNNARLSWINYQLKPLFSKEPVSKLALDKARGLAQSYVPKFEAALMLKPPPPLLIPRATGAITIDGNLDEPD